MLYVPFLAGSGEQRFEVDFDGRLPVRDGCAFRIGKHSVEGTVVLKQAVDDQGAALLRNEVDIGERLLGRIPPGEYPVQLSRLIGYTPLTRPRLALLTYRRDDLGAVVERPELGTDELTAVVKDLLTGLQWLDHARVVHGGLSGAAGLRWDGRSVMVADFGRAVRQGTPRRRAGTAPWDPPECLAGQGPADPRDDVYTAALLITRLATREETRTPEEAERVMERMDFSFRRLLDGTRAERAAHRPYARELLRRLGSREPAKSPVWGLLDAERDARAEFARLRAEQRAFRAKHARRLAARGAAAATREENAATRRRLVLRLRDGERLVPLAALAAGLLTALTVLGLLAVLAMLVVRGR